MDYLEQAFDRQCTIGCSPYCEADFESPQVPSDWSQTQADEWNLLPPPVVEDWSDIPEDFEF